MSFSLYAAVIASCCQIRKSVSGLLGTAEAFCTDKGVAFGKRDYIGRLRRKI